MCISPIEGGYNYTVAFVSEDGTEIDKKMFTIFQDRQQKREGIAVDVLSLNGCIEKKKKPLTKLFNNGTVDEIRQVVDEFDAKTLLKNPENDGILVVDLRDRDLNYTDRQVIKTWEDAVIDGFSETSNRQQVEDIKAMLPQDRLYMVREGLLKHEFQSGQVLGSRQEVADFLNSKKGTKPFCQAIEPIITAMKLRDEVRFNGDKIDFKDYFRPLGEAPKHYRPKMKTITYYPGTYKEMYCSGSPFEEGMKEVIDVQFEGLGQGFNKGTFSWRD